ncbi:pilus assembly protein TadG-related protein [Micromonospora soli]|uniref:pilus assembly protein TadG-related protein n=1 Tax=Micromonospora sp. NBRC 110009 TaxID=3061627 RepID=UPI002673905A|nr:TadE/TadG family type IV pilus assembly protein [Micromonospora sp. NBRC 110009]WKU01104.1 pilus assembly protein TadG-related protein [Micromonospora sp. NBRC 110009]
MPVIRLLRARLTAAGADRGAVALTVGLLLSTGVLLGMAALVVDVGNLYVERGQLQNGADGGALRIGQLCATDPVGCSRSGTDLTVVAESYAERSANDDAAAATVCGRGGPLSACPAWQDRLTDCVGPPPESVDYVEVQTSTRTGDGSTVLPPFFAQAVVGGYQGAEVGACSRVAWGPPATANTLAMTISACDWNRYTGNGAFPPDVRSFPVYNEDASTTCPPGSGSAGGGPGGFRFLKDADDDCRTTSTIGDGRRANTGDSRPTSCRNKPLEDLVTAGRPILVPVFGEITGGGGNADYLVSGFAAFVITGWQLPGLDVPPTGGSLCDAGESCVYGYFTEMVVPGGGAIGGPDLGARVVAPIG